MQRLQTIALRRMKIGRRKEDARWETATRTRRTKRTNVRNENNDGNERKRTTNHEKTTTHDNDEDNADGTTNNKARQFSPECKKHRGTVVKRM